MRRNRPDDDGGSLDLLLDTITNTLGGILFLAILLVLLPKATRAIEGKSEHSSTELETLREALGTAQARVERGQASADLSEAVLESVVDPTSADELKEAQRLQSELENLIREKKRLGLAIKRIGEEQSQIAEEEKVEKENTQQVAKDLATLKGEYEGELNRRRSDLPLPSERAITTRGVPVTIRYGRLYFFRGRSPWDDNSANMDDLIQVGEEDGYRVVTPKPWGGVRILDDEHLTDDVRNAINVWPAREYHFELATWDDSYDAVQAVRSHFVSRGQYYRFIPVTEGDEVIEGNFQNARVQ